MPPSAWLGPLYEQFRTELFLTAWTTLRRREPAEDAVHAAIVRLAALDVPPREPKLYLFRAVRNAAVDLARKQSRRREMTLAEASDVASQEADATETFDAETVGAVRTLIESLDERSRETVELRLYAGLTFREIADLFEEPLPTVASRYRRALERLGQSLETPHE